jgi:hypothetical protein
MSAMSIADRLYKGLVDAKNLALARLKRGHPLMLPWLHHDLRELDEVFGGDPYPCGIEANRPSLEALVQYMVEQNFIPKRIPVEDIFVPVTRRCGSGISRFTGAVRHTHCAKPRLSPLVPRAGPARKRKSDSACGE